MGGCDSRDLFPYVWAAILGLESFSINGPRAFESGLQIDLCDVKEVTEQGGNNVAMGGIDQMNGSWWTNYSAKQLGHWRNMVLMQMGYTPYIYFWIVFHRHITSEFRVYPPKRLNHLLMKVSTYHPRKQPNDFDFEHHHFLRSSFWVRRWGSYIVYSFILWQLSICPFNFIIQTICDEDNQSSYFPSIFFTQKNLTAFKQWILFWCSSLAKDESFISLKENPRNEFGIEGVACLQCLGWFFAGIDMFQ